MKKLLFGLLLSTITYGHGWLEITGAHWPGPGKVGPVIAVGLLEPLLLGISYQSWNGLGIDVREALWATSKHGLNLELQDGVDLTVGVSLRHNDVNYSDVYATMKFRLWD